MSEILKMSAPRGIEIEVKNLDDAVAFLNETSAATKRLIILVKSPNYIEDLLKQGIAIEKVIVGGMGANSERSVLYKNISASDAERLTFKEIIAQGVKVAIHIIPDQKETDLEKYL
jgi:PTS system mannose-specific IIB component